MGTVDDAFQSLDYLDQRGHVGDLIERWGLQLDQQGADLLLGNRREGGAGFAGTVCSSYSKKKSWLRPLN